MTQHLILFGTDCCHLCEQAKALIRLNDSVQSETISIEIIDIAEHPHWYDKYSLTIPVIFHEQSQAELGWPFDEQTLTLFIDGVIGND